MEALLIEPKSTHKNHTRYLYEQHCNNDALCDLKVTFMPEYSSPFHRCVLAARSLYFDRLFTGPFPESKLQELRITATDSMEEPEKTLNFLIAFLYGQPCDLSWDVLASVLWLSDYLGVEACRPWCKKELCEQLTLDGAWGVWSLASLYGEENLERLSSAILAARMQDYFLQSDHLLDFDYEMLRVIRSCGLLDLVSQTARAQFIVKWGSHDTKARKHLLPSLVKEWSVCKVSLKASVSRSALDSSMFESRSVLEDNKEYSESNKVVDSYIAISYRDIPYLGNNLTNYGEPTENVFDSVGHKDVNVFLLDPEENIWKQVPERLRMALKHSSDASLAKGLSPEEIAVDKHTRVFSHGQDFYVMQTLNLQGTEDVSILRYSGADTSMSVFVFEDTIAERLSTLEGNGEYFGTGMSQWTVLTAELADDKFYVLLAAFEHKPWIIQGIGYALCTIPLPMNKENCTVTILPIQAVPALLFHQHEDYIAQRHNFQLLKVDELILCCFWRGDKKWDFFRNAKLHVLCYDENKQTCYELKVPHPPRTLISSVTCDPQKRVLHILNGSDVHTLDLDSGKCIFQPKLFSVPWKHTERVSCFGQESRFPQRSYGYVKNPWCESGDCKIGYDEMRNCVGLCMNKDKIAWLASPAPHANKLVECRIGGSSCWRDLPPPPTQFVGSLRAVGIQKSVLSGLEMAAYVPVIRSDYRPFGLCCPVSTDYSYDEVVEPYSLAPRRVK